MMKLCYVSLSRSLKNRSHKEYCVFTLWLRLLNCNGSIQTNYRITVKLVSGTGIGRGSFKVLLSQLENKKSQFGQSVP
jgi:hypothetical protein